MTGSASSSTARWAGSSLATACASQVCLAFAVSSLDKRPLSVNWTFSLRASAASSTRRTKPICSNGAMATAIDCGFIPSALASSADVIRSVCAKRIKTAFCVHVNSFEHAGAAARMRRTRSCSASARSRLSCSGERSDFIITMRPHDQFICQYPRIQQVPRTYCADACRKASSTSRFYVCGIYRRVRSDGGL
ncbi:hypothetical protein SAMN05443245_7260 [Paraburkholderia fungorum]|uniref:Uncharacterized protein n=1 Tax=Paraburkholderia fungorum TaxID=134537 RepID=A0A1H1JVB8_9BURK|nr:hypothetical protein SAMN05443245_7260 [Paraburkholderia fungorum]